MLKSESSRFAVMMISIAVIGFGGMGIWAYINDAMREYTIVVGGTVLVYGFIVGMFTWVDRGE